MLQLAASIALLFVVTAAAHVPPRPVAARIVGRTGHAVAFDRYGDIVGNVEVVFSNGHKEIWTRSLQCELPRVSKSGLVGWTYADDRHSRGVWMNNVLCIARSRRDISHFDADAAFIDLWDFTDNDTCVVIRYRNIHGPSWIDKIRLDTGETTEHCFGSGTVEETPEWARPYIDDVD